MAITMTDFTRNVQVDNDNVVTGDGIFDDMMEAVNTHIKAQYDAGRINGTDYASVYLGALQATIAEATKILMNKDIVDAQVVTEGNKAALVARQTKGFDDDAKQKLLKQTLDSWSVAYSVAQDANAIPDSIKVDSVDSILKNALDNLNINVSTNPIGL